MTTYEIDISMHDDCWISKIPDIHKLTRSVIGKVLKQHLLNENNVEISVVLANNMFIQELNKNYRGHDKPTNVLSFPQTNPADLKDPEASIILGDIIAAYETIFKEAKEQNKSIDDHYTHMLVHSCLHLLHYDHESNKEADIMEFLEVEILNTMGIKNPYESS